MINELIFANQVLMCLKLSEKMKFQIAVSGKEIKNGEMSAELSVWLGIPPFLVLLLSSWV